MPPKVCEVGGKGLFLPLGGDSEQEWPTGLRIILYFVGLLWTFAGVALVADTFMAAIERITSKKSRVLNTSTGRYMTVMVWNGTVANLTLMALGSSAPEILLSVIEIVSSDFFSGELGPSTIVGSAAFNLLCITAVCVVAIPNGDIRKIQDTSVYSITAFCSIFAYVWLVVILMGITPNVVDVWEGILTFLFFPMLVTAAFLADKGYLAGSVEDRKKSRMSHVVNADMSKEELAEAALKVRKIHGDHLTDDQVKQLLLTEFQAPKTRAQYRVAATREMTGSRRVSMVTFPEADPMYNVVPTVGAGDDPKEVQKLPQATVEFACAKYTVLENAGTARVQVHRLGKTLGKFSLEFATREGTAKEYTDFKPVKGVLDFGPDDDAQVIGIEIIDDVAFEEDESFFIDLFEPESDTDFVTLGGCRTAEVVIVDDDHPGTLRFQDETISTSCADDHDLTVHVERVKGGTGKIGCKFRTEEGSAIAGLDFEETSGSVEFASGQMTAKIVIKVKAAARYEREELFRVIIEEPFGGTKFDETTDGGESSCICSIIIKPDPAQTERIDRLFTGLLVNWDRAMVGHTNWKDQFKDAIFVNGGEDAMAEASLQDWVVHIILLPWKLFVAIVPPTDFCGGWACFFAALAVIGIVTAFISDMASLLGCVLDIPDSITAITFVALGTSLPDTFASKTAAIQDPSADASIGNITGSNSVNVFLGLGLPWTVGSLYWSMNGATQEWSRRYALKDWAQDHLDGALVVEADALGFSVIVFSSCAVACVGLLAIRRKFCGGELGGEPRLKMASSGFLVSLWLIYVALSAWNDLADD